MAGSPRIIVRPTTRSPAACRRARVRQGQAFGGAEEAPSLTDAARDGDGNMRSGRKNARGAGRTKEWNDKGRQKWRDPPIDKESPIQAGCPNRACPDLCGGCPAMGIPTAILGQSEPPSFVAATAELASIADAGEAWRGPRRAATSPRRQVLPNDRTPRLRGLRLHRATMSPLPGTPEISVFLSLSESCQRDMP
jgi:hypothetical protein